MCTTKGREKEIENAVFTKETASAALAIVNEILSNKEMRIKNGTECCGLEIKNYAELNHFCEEAIRYATKVVIFPKPETDFDTVMEYNIDQFKDWMSEIRAYIYPDTLHGTFCKIYAMIDESTIPVIEEAMKKARLQYNPLTAPQEGLYLYIFNSKVLKGILIAELIKFFQ